MIPRPHEKLTHATPRGWCAWQKAWVDYAQQFVRIELGNGKHAYMGPRYAPAADLARSWPGSITRTSISRSGVHTDGPILRFALESDTSVPLSGFWMRDTGEWSIQLANGKHGRSELDRWMRVADMQREFRRHTW